MHAPRATWLKVHRPLRPSARPPNQARLPAQDIPSEAEYDLLHLNAVLNWTKGVCSNGTSCGGPFNLYGSTFQARYTPPQVKVPRAALVLQHWWPCSHAFARIFWWHRLSILACMSCYHNVAAADKRCLMLRRRLTRPRRAQPRWSTTCRPPAPPTTTWPAATVLHSPAHALQHSRVTACKLHAIA